MCPVPLLSLIDDLRNFFIMDDLLYLFFIENLDVAENQQIMNHQRKPDNPFTLNEERFRKIFRLSKNLRRNLIEILTPLLTAPKRARDLDIPTKVLIALHFYAYGNYQTSVGQNRYLDVSQSTVSLCLKEVTNALNNPVIFNEWVSFPNNFDALNKIRRRFYEEHNFPGVIGCIDCTHIAIHSPLISDPEFPENLYVNRKNYHSINTQLICDADLKILNVNAKYPGSTNDSYIWGRSNVQELMKNLHQRGYTDYFLLGDSGYPLRPWLLTPLDYNPPENSIEKRYNDTHKRTRVKIECCNGVLKSRFRCLLKHRVLHYDPLFACQIINACVVLHNMCIEYNIPEVELEPEDNQVDFGMFRNENQVEIGDENVFARINPDLAKGRRLRAKIIQSFC